MKILTLAILLIMHPVHVTLTGVGYNREDRIYNVFVKVYSDDLESDMKICLKKAEMTTADKEQLYEQYINDRLIISENGQMLAMKLVTTESDGLEHRFNLVAHGKKGVSDVSVMNRFMVRLYSDQANMLMFSFGNTEEGYKFTAIDTLRNYNVK